MTHLAAALSSLQLPARALDPLSKFGDLLFRWNRRINLSAARSPAQIEDHIIDSLHVIPHLLLATPSSPQATLRILDVGAGGGLPCVITAILLPHAHVTALEPVHKKHAFLRTAARELDLPNLEPLAQRVEDHPHVAYDAAMSRATFDLRDWLLLGLSYLRPGGIVFGFEAIPRSDLPPDTTRHPYAFGDKSRAIVSLMHP